MKKYVEIIGPCSKYIDGKGWVTQIPEELLFAKGYINYNIDNLINVVNHCLNARKDKKYNCENCVKGSEQDVILTCRSVLEEISKIRGSNAELEEIVATTVIPRRENVETKQKIGPTPYQCNNCYYANGEPTEEDCKKCKGE